MARACVASKICIVFLFSTFLLSFISQTESANLNLDDHNWMEILEGEWMVQFHAPWCPACNALASAWKEMSTRAAQKKLKLLTGAVDVTQSPGLSGRFVVTALPTIFHVKNGEFRQYKGPRDADAMLSYVEQEKWTQTEPIPGWKAPNSLQMTLVAEFFKFSQGLRGVHTMLMETYGLPTWGSYLIFALVTIFVGAILGLILVCVIDLLYPPRRPGKVLLSQAELDELARGDQDAKEKSDDDQELLNDDIVDDADNAGSDAEKNSPSDTSEEEKEAAGDTAASAADGKEDKPSEVRKRRPRKAD